MKSILFQDGEKPDIHLLMLLALIGIIFKQHTTYAMPEKGTRSDKLLQKRLKELMFRTELGNRA